MIDFRELVGRLTQSFVEDLHSSVENALSYAEVPQEQASKLLSEGDLLLVVLIETLISENTAICSYLMKQLRSDGCLDYLHIMEPRMRSLINRSAEDYGKAASFTCHLAENNIFDVPPEIISFLESLSGNIWETPPSTPEPSQQDPFEDKPFTRSFVRRPDPPQQVSRSKEEIEEAQRELLNSVKNKDLSALSAALEKGANVNAKDGNGLTPLHLAASVGDIDMVKCLLLAGGDAGIRDDGGWAPLHEAAAKGAVKVVDCLLDSGGDLEVRDKWGWTPLHWAAWNGRLSTSQFLVSRGALVNSTDIDGDTPLSLAIRYDHLSVVQYLRKVIKDKETAAQRSCAIS